MATFASLVQASAALASRSDDNSGLVRYVEARLAESNNDTQKAISIYAEGLKADPDNLLLADKAYMQAVAAGRFDLALTAANRLIARGKVQPAMSLLPFTDAFARNDLRSAEQSFAQLRADESFGFAAPMLEAWVAVKRGTDSITPLVEARKNPTVAYYYESQLILQLLATGQEDAAKRQLRILVERNESTAAPLRMIAARHFWAKKDRQTALDILQAQRTGPEQRLYQQMSKGDRPGIAQPVNANLGVAFLYQRLSTDLAAQNAVFLAQVMAQMGYHLQPAWDYAQLTIGQTYADAGNYPVAIGFLAKIADDSPYYLAAIGSEVSSLIAQNDFTQATARVNSAIAASPQSAELHILNGQVQQAAGDQAAAAAAFAKAVALAEAADFPDSLLANYWLALGGAQEQAGMWTEGLQSLKRANSLQPNSANILNYLGYAQLTRRENEKEAVALVKQAYDLRPASPAITDSLGWAYFITGDAAKSVGYLELALSGQPQDPTINEHLGDAYWTVGRRYEARYAWRSAALFADGDDVTRLSSKIETGLTPELISP